MTGRQRARLAQMVAAKLASSGDDKIVALGAQRIMNLAFMIVDTIADEIKPDPIIEDGALYSEIAKQTPRAAPLFVGVSYDGDDEISSIRTKASQFTLYHVHDESTCAGRTCIIHSPTEHHMSTWPLHWRDDRGIFERFCSHGTPHPDPDQFDHWRETGRVWAANHGCDLCCGRARARAAA